MILSLTLWTCIAVTQATVTVDPRIQIGMTKEEVVRVLRDQPLTISSGNFGAGEACVFLHSKLHIAIDARGRVASVTRIVPK